MAAVDAFAASAIGEIEMQQARWAA